MATATEQVEGIGRIHRISQDLGIVKWGPIWCVGELATMRAGRLPEQYGGAFYSRDMAVAYVTHLVEREGFR